MTPPIASAAYPKRFLRAAKQTTEFSGRSTVDDVMAFLIGYSVISFACMLVFAPLLAVYDHEMSWVWLVFGMPFFSLFVRRVHDQGRSAWWLGVFLAVLVLLAFDENVYWARVTGIGFDLPWWMEAPLMYAAFILLALMLAPGTPGPNRFGPDPRQTDKV